MRTTAAMVLPIAIPTIAFVLDAALEALPSMSLVGSATTCGGNETMQVHPNHTDVMCLSGHIHRLTTTTRILIHCTLDIYYYTSHI